MNGRVPPSSLPDGQPFVPDPEVTVFFDAMLDRGSEYMLSPEATGMQILNQQNSTRTEGFAIFYDPEMLEPADGPPSGFLADDGSAHSVFDRVPCAFPLRVIDSGYDFVLVTVLLHNGHGASHEQLRAAELHAIADWVSSKQSGRTTSSSSVTWGSTIVTRS